MYALIQNDDIKSQEIAKKINGIELYRMKGSTNMIPIHIIKQIFLRRKLPKALILRYLNDSNSYIKSLIRFITNLITLFLSKLLRIKLIWICHNVDKESNEYYPFFVKYRRKIVAKLSNKILVTDQLLIKHASRILKVEESKIDYITFGQPSPNFKTEEQNNQKIIDFIETGNYKNTLIGLSIGNPNPKVLHPFYTDKLIKEARKVGRNLKIILGGPLGEFIQRYDINVYNNLLSNPNVLFLDGKINFDEKYISQYIDFYWRVYDDYSVPYTVYSSTYLNKPILTMNKGFIKEMVLKYNIGSVLENDMSNVLEVLDDLENDRSKEFNEFVNSHTWSKGAQNLYKAICNN